MNSSNIFLIYLREAQGLCPGPCNFTRHDDDHEELIGRINNFNTALLYVEFDHEPSRKEREEFIRNTIIVIVHRYMIRGRIRKIVRDKCNKSITGGAHGEIL